MTRQDEARHGKAGQGKRRDDNSSTRMPHDVHNVHMVFMIFITTLMRFMIFIVFIPGSRRLPVLVPSSCSWASLGHWLQECDLWCCFLWVATFFVLPSLGKNYVRSHAHGPGHPAHALPQSTYLLLVYFSATWNTFPTLLKKCSPTSAGN